MDRSPQVSGSGADEQQVDLARDPEASTDRFAARTSPAVSADSPWTDRLVNHFIGLGQAPGGDERLVEASVAVLTAQRNSLSGGRPGPALELARVAAPAFLLGARWGAWASTLDLGLEAAEALDDRGAQGWALHELGVRAMALGRYDEADECLSRALGLRAELDADLAETRVQQDLLAARRGVAS